MDAGSPRAAQARVKVDRENPQGGDQRQCSVIDLVDSSSDEQSQVGRQLSLATRTLPSTVERRLFLSSGKKRLLDGTSCEEAIDVDDDDSDDMPLSTLLGAKRLQSESRWSSERTRPDLVESQGPSTQRATGEAAEQGSSPQCAICIDGVQGREEPAQRKTTTQAEQKPAFLRSPSNHRGKPDEPNRRAGRTILSLTSSSDDDSVTRTLLSSPRSRFSRIRRRRRTSGTASSHPFEASLKRQVITILDDSTDEDIPLEAFSPLKAASTRQEALRIESSSDNSDHDNNGPRKLAFPTKPEVVSSAPVQGLPTCLGRDQTVERKQHTPGEPTFTTVSTAKSAPHASAVHDSGVEEEPSPANPGCLESSTQQILEKAERKRRLWNAMAKRLRRDDIDSSPLTVSPTERKESQRTIAPLWTNGTGSVEGNDLPQMTEEDVGFEGGEDPPVCIENADRELMTMNFIEKLSHKFLDRKTELPVFEFSVFGSPDDIIYDFELNVRQSTIPNAGRGVFLTFKGARELKPSKKNYGEQVLQTRRLKVSKLLEPLQTWHPHGFGMAVTVTGEHLLGRYNSKYIRRPLRAEMPSENGAPTKELGVCFADEDLPYDPLELAGLQDPQNRIGHLGLYTESDYVKAPRRTFCSLHDNCGIIDIGRYGPFRKEDRKSDLHFQVKSFLFGFEPAEWAFEVPEEAFGDDQRIDITDDLTGEPHETARQNIPMYVNEVGHNKKLKQTVHALEKDGRSVHYFLEVRDPMKQGDTIEIFVDYFKAYEGTRERKGYGKANLKGMKKGDCDLSSLLLRNFVERRDLLQDINELPLVEYYRLVNSLEGIREGLHNVVGRFLERKTVEEEGSPTQRPTAQQLVALRRLDWLGPIFEQRCDDFEASAAGSNRVASHASICMLSQSRHSIYHFQWDRWGTLIDFLAHNGPMGDARGVGVSEAFLKEITEEICFSLKEDILSPMDPSVWCEVAVNLTKRLCKITAECLWLDGGDKRPPNYQRLANAYVGGALEAAQAIRSPGDLSWLAFHATGKRANGNQCNQTPEQVIVCKEMGSGAASGSHQTLEGYRRIPMSALGSSTQEPHQMWYLCWQVVHIASVFAKNYLPSSLVSLESLCSCLGISVTAATVIIEAQKLQSRSSEGIQASSSGTKPRATPKKGVAKKTSETHQAKKPQMERANGALFWNIIWPSLKEIGWNLERGNRPNDFYACPPGVGRGKGFRNRVDFFDSVPLVITFVKSDPRWCKAPEVVESLRVYYVCKEEYERLMKAKQLPKFKDKAEMTRWLRGTALKEAKQ